MDRSTIANCGRQTFALLDQGHSPVDCEQYKLDRLFELRAVIDSLRVERDTAPPAEDPYAGQERSLGV